ncbi:hypothetical protein SteCoe_9842 [Stentor coeruleus]|uniref:G-protein coupled receptors family 2 profile 2 domain-containing protein n=1 Tax=Stentor coeruleus TaxID=5963 RepID=A0A1R2CGX7_9CILI|nr:hypothetical protein SteCoe_9842 [Stentor coeruleus]
MSDVHEYISILVSSFLSLLGCTFILFLYYKYKSLQGQAYKLISILAIIDIFHCIAFMIPTYNEDIQSTRCICQAISITAITLASILWTFVISVFLYIGVVKKKSYEDKIFKVLFICIVLCLIVAFIPPLVSGFHNFTNKSGWCWIKDECLKFFVLYLPLWLVIITNTGIYMVVIKHLKLASDMHPELKHLGISMIRKLRMYPIILIISFLPVTMYRIFEFFKADDDKNETFIIVAGMFTCLNGFFNAIVYGCTKNVRNVLTSRRVGIERYSRMEGSPKGISIAQNK